jgi:hypothetical protein
LVAISSSVIVLIVELLLKYVIWFVLSKGVVV